MLVLAGPEVAFGLVEGGCHVEVVDEAQDVAFPVVEDFEEEAGLAFAGAVAVGDGVGQSDEDALAEQADQLVLDGRVDLGPALLAGEVRARDKIT